MLDKGMVLVLWTNYFDEVAATSLVTAFRKLGIRVKLVGLSHRGATGASGLTLVPDVTLEQAIAIANRATVVVMPGTQSAVQRLDNDPRVRDLLSRAYANQATFVTSAEAAQAVMALVGAQDAHLAIEPYPANKDMIEFADRLAAAAGTELVTHRSS
jgi:hypothetical protein